MLPFIDIGRLFIWKTPYYSPKCYWTYPHIYWCWPEVPSCLQMCTVWKGSWWHLPCSQNGRCSLPGVRMWSQMSADVHGVHLGVSHNQQLKYEWRRWIIFIANLFWGWMVLIDICAQLVYVYLTCQLKVIYLGYKSVLRNVVFIILSASLVVCKSHVC